MINNSTYFTIIIPVYNAEKYIKKCLISIFEQTTTDNVEIVIINDCSKDNSLSIIENLIEEYCYLKEQIILISHKINHGITYTRGEGIKIAHGTYICWCDADDWCETQLFEKLKKECTQKDSDIIVYNYHDVNEKTLTQVKIRKSVTPIDCLSKSYQGKYYSGCLWNQLIKKTILSEIWTNIEHTNYGEDTFATWHIYLKAKSITFLEDFLYFHNQDNINSLVHNIEISNITWQAQYKNLKCIYQKCKTKKNDWNKLKTAFYFMAYSRKELYKKAFTSCLSYHFTFRTASFSILNFPGMSLSNRIKSFLVNNIYILHLIYEL